MLVSRISPRLSFGRALRDDEIEDFKKTVSEGKKLTGQTGNSVFIMPSTSMPQSAAVNTGAGNLVSPESIKYLTEMKTYLDYNVVEDLPMGQFKNNHYNTSSLSLGDQNINTELLTTEEYGSILKKEEFDEIVKANNKETKETLANFENVSGNESAQGKALKKAFERFKELDANSDLKKKYNKFTEDNAEILNIKRESEPDADFFKFKQFLAEDHHSKALAKLHENGLKYCVDVPLNFDDDEVKAFPKAFKADHYMGAPGWKMPALDFETILDANSDANKLLKMKIQYAAKHGDMLRLDAAWNYVTPVISHKDQNEIVDGNRKPLQEALVKQIEDWVKEVKGQDFDVKKNLMYEFEAGLNEFSAFWDGKLIPGVKDRVNIYQTTYMNDGWGSNEAFQSKGWTPDELSVGVGNQDTQPLKQIAEGVKDTVNGNAVHKNASINPLAKILKLDAESLNDAAEFSKAKWAETLLGKNTHFFFMDAFGRSERFNEHNEKSATSFRYKVPADYKKGYFEALKEGFGFNIMDALAKAMKAKGLDESNPDLYGKIVKFSNILADKEEAAKPEASPAANSAGEAASNSKAAAETAEEAAETAAKTASKETTKAARSYKPLWYTIGALAVIGGAYTLIKNRHPKPAHKEEPKPAQTTPAQTQQPQQETKKLAANA